MSWPSVNQQSPEQRNSRKTVGYETGWTRFFNCNVLYVSASCFDCEVEFFEDTTTSWLWAAFSQWLVQVCPCSCHSHIVTLLSLLVCSWPIRDGYFIFLLQYYYNNNLFKRVDVPKPVHWVTYCTCGLQCLHTLFNPVLERCQILVGLVPILLLALGK